MSPFEAMNQALAESRKAVDAINNITDQDRKLIDARTALESGDISRWAIHFNHAATTAAAANKRD